MIELYSDDNKRISHSLVLVLISVAVVVMEEGEEEKEERKWAESDWISSPTHRMNIPFHRTVVVINDLSPS